MLPVNTEFEVNTLLKKLDSYQIEANAGKLVVKWFLDLLAEAIEDSQLLAGSTFVGVGSSYEGLAVKEECDFDIAMILPEPLHSDNFRVVEVKDPGIFKLQCRSLQNNSYLRPYIDKNYFLDIRSLRDAIFIELRHIIKTKLLGFNPDAKYSYAEEGRPEKRFSACSFQFHLKEILTTKKISYDLTPVIKANYNDIPKIRNSETLPPHLRSFVAGNRDCVYLCLSAPPFLHKNYGDQVVQAAFDLLEFETMRNHQRLRDSVRITKYRTSGCKRLGLRSFYIKRVAIEIFDEIEFKKPMDGYKCIMRRLIELCSTPVIPSFFIKSQDILHKDPESCSKLRKSLIEVYQ